MPSRTDDHDAAFRAGVSPQRSLRNHSNVDLRIVSLIASSRDLTGSSTIINDAAKSKISFRFAAGCQKLTARFQLPSTSRRTIRSQPQAQSFMLLGNQVGIFRPNLSLSSDVWLAVIIGAWDDSRDTR